MTEEQRRELYRLAYATNNAVLNRLVCLYDAGEMHPDEWAHYAIVTLAKHSATLEKQLIGIVQRLPNSPF